MKLNNKYYLLRHGEAVSNVKNIVSSWREKFKNPLTDVGVQMINDAAIKLADKKIDLIFASPLLRTKQTAKIVGKALKVKVKFDKRLREISFGIFNGKNASDWENYFTSEEYAIANRPPGGENYDDVLDRIYEFLMDIDKKYKGKHILIVSHQCPLWILENKVNGFALQEGLIRTPEQMRINKGELRELN
ncbi:MAG: histidine phosphatase family protein [Candidatus Staskawiczbacteria bacterium]|nr:histidine phosphatase family protein [Candidatus Staskawiczbacteria bacterium]